MAFNDMYQQLLGIPGMNLGLAKTFINEAFVAIQNERVWSFQCITGGWLTPGILGAPSGFGTGGFGVQTDNHSIGGPSDIFDNGSTNGIVPTQFLSPGTI